MKIRAREECQILIKHEFSRHFSKNIKISLFMKIRAVGAELYYAGGQTDRHDEADSRFFTILRKCLKRVFKFITTFSCVKNERPVTGCREHQLNFGSYKGLSVALAGAGLSRIKNCCPAWNY
jgi:hypothetical protein